MDAHGRPRREAAGGHRPRSGPALSFEERLSGAQAPALYAISLAVVFLCLAALYESWTIPVVGAAGRAAGHPGRRDRNAGARLSNDVFFQVGLLATMGLAAKSAILIVEFAKESYDRGETLVDSVMHAAAQRLRPILMTSLAFMFGVLPLALATGAGSGAQNAVGTGVIGGMLASTFLSIFFVPVFFVLVLGGFHVKPGYQDPATGREIRAGRADLSRSGCFELLQIHAPGTGRVRVMSMALRTLVVLLLGTGVAAATERREFDFDVTLDGRPIGSHRYELIPSGPGSYEVDSRASFDFNVLGVPLYRYRHQALERITNDCLERIEALTRDNGESLSVRGARSDDGFLLETPAGKPQSRDCVMGYAYWDLQQLLRRRELLNPQTGEFDAVSVEFQGKESLLLQGEAVPARRYRLRSAQLVIDLWYSESGAWLQLESQVRGGAPAALQPAGLNPGPLTGPRAGAG